MARIDTSVNEDMKRRYTALCAERGVSTGAAIRMLIDQQLIEADPSLAPMNTLVEKRDSGQREGVTVWFTPSEKMALKHTARRMSCSTSYLLVCCARAMMTAKPQFVSPEIEVLRESNYLLRSVARDLNQARRERGDESETGSLYGLIDTLKKQTKNVDNMMRACTERWLIR